MALLLVTQMIPKGSRIVLRFPVKNFDLRFVTKSEHAKSLVCSGDSSILQGEGASLAGS